MRISSEFGGCEDVLGTQATLEYQGYIPHVLVIYITFIILIDFVSPTIAIFMVCFYFTYLFI